MNEDLKSTLKLRNNNKMIIRMDKNYLIKWGITEQLF